MLENTPTQSTMTELLGQPLFYYLGQIQKEMVSVLPAPLFPVPSHADGRRTRRRIFEELAKRD